MLSVFCNTSVSSVAFCTFSECYVQCMPLPSHFASRLVSTIHLQLFCTFCPLFNFCLSVLCLFVIVINSILHVQVTSFDGVFLLVAPLYCFNCSYCFFLFWLTKYLFVCLSVYLSIYNNARFYFACKHIVAACNTCYFPMYAI